TESNSDPETIIDSDPEHLPTPPEIWNKLTRTQRRTFILGCFLEGKNVGETVRCLNARFNNCGATFHKKKVKIWFKRFKLGDYTCQDKIRKGRPHSVS